MAVSWPFDSTLTQDTNGNPVYSRAYSSDILARFLAKYFRNGVFSDTSTGFQVVAASGMTVKVHPGFANINGRQVYEEVDRVLTVQASNASLDRIDSVVLRLNLLSTALTIDLYIVQGTAAASPTAPALTRNASTWELGLANLFITKGIATITQERITDTRLDSARCGVVSSTIATIDTSTFYAQIAADLAAFKSGRQTDFDTWFQTMRNTLGTDAAGSLLSQIQQLDTKKQDLLTSSHPLPISQGGTGASSNADALTNLGCSRLAVAGSATGIANVVIPSGSSTGSISISALNLSLLVSGPTSSTPVMLCSVIGTAYPQGRTCSIRSVSGGITIYAGLTYTANADTTVSVQWLVLYL